MCAPDLYANLAENGSVLAMWLGRDGRVRRVNRAFELVSGWSAAEATGRLWPEDFGASRAELDPAHFSGTTSLPPRSAPAAVAREVQWSGSVLPGESGVLVVGGVAAHTAAAHGHLVKGLLDAFPGLVGLYTPGGEMIDACRDSLALTGRTRGAPNPRLAELPLFNADPGLRDHIRDAFARAAHGETVSFDGHTPNVPPGRPLSSAALTVRPVFSEGGLVTHVASFAVDTTGLEAAVTELRASEARLREAQRITKVGSWLAHDGRFELSEELSRIFELDPPRSEAPYETLLAIVHPDDREAVDRAFQRSRAEREPYDQTARLRMPDGRIKWVRARGETALDAASGTLGTFGTTQDVTEARYGKDLLTELHHRVNNNLQLISSMLRLAFRESPDGGVNATLASALHRVEAIALAHEHLSLAPSLEPRDMARHLKRLVEAIVATHGPSTSVVLDIQAPTLDISPDDFMNLGMIANELLVNAFQHGIARRTSGRIVVSLSIEAARAQLVVIDDGPGIQPPTTSTLGLQIVTQLAQRMGGEAHWAEAPGGGTRASVSFPLRPAGPRAAG